MYFEKGSYVHEVLHYYYSLVKAGYPVGGELIIKAVTDRIKEDVAGADDLSFFRDTTKTILPYIQKISPKIDNKIAAVEHEYHLEIKAPNHDVLLHGFVDLLYYDSIRKKWVIRDHKTGQKNSWSNESLERDIQLLMYGTLWYKLTGEVAIVQVNFLHSKPASAPKATTVLYGLFEAHHTESTYKAFWEYLQVVLDRMENPQTMQNLSACDYCAFYRICRAGLRGYSADQIKRANFNGPHNKQRQEVPGENSSIGIESAKPFHIVIGR